MLAYLLALTVGLGSFALYMAAFFFPEVHRKNDFIWSGVGLFYALVLWICAARITGGVLLGQAASVTLLGWLGWQTLLLRRQVAPAEQQTAVPTSEELKATVVNLASPETVSKLAGQVSQQAGKLKTWGQAKLKPVASPEQTSARSSEEPYVPLTPADFASADRPTFPDVPAVSIAESAPIPEPPRADPIAPEPVSFPDLSTAEKPTTEKPPSQKITQKSPEQKSTGGFGGALQQMLGGGNKKRETKPVYVRKQFRDPEPETAIAVSPEAAVEAALRPEPTMPEAAVASTGEAAIVEDSDLPSDAILESEIAYEADHPDLKPTSEAAPPQAVPPHPPAPELVEAALMDAEEKDLPASPPATEPSATESQALDQ